MDLFLLEASNSELSKAVQSGLSEAVKPILEIMFILFLIELIFQILKKVFTKLFKKDNKTKKKK